MAYLERLVKAYAEHPEIFRPGTVSEPQVKHDDWCPILKGKSSCSCDADIEVVVDGRRYEILNDGALHSLGASAR